MKEDAQDVAIAVSTTLHRQATQIKLLKAEAEQLRASIATKIKRRSHSEALPLPVNNGLTGGASFFTPRSIRVALLKLDEEKAHKHQEKLQKQKEKGERAAKKLAEDQAKEQRRVKRARGKEEKEKEKADKAAKKQAKKEERDRVKALQTAQKGKHKASKAPLEPKKKQKRSVGGAVGGAMGNVAERAATPQPTRQTQSGRSMKLLSKFR